MADKMERLEDRQERALNREYDQMDASYQALVKYGFLTNAGGCVATLSFVGAVFEGQQNEIFSVLPLSIFVAGLFFNGLSHYYMSYARMVRAKYFGDMAVASATGKPVEGSADDSLAEIRESGDFIIHATQRALYSLYAFFVGSLISVPFLLLVLIN